MLNIVRTKILDSSLSASAPKVLSWDWSSIRCSFCLILPTNQSTDKPKNKKKLFWWSIHLIWVLFKMSWFLCSSVTVNWASLGWGPNKTSEDIIFVFGRNWWTLVTIYWQKTDKWRKHPAEWFAVKKTVVTLQPYIRDKSATWEPTRTSRERKNMSRFSKKACWKQAERAQVALWPVQLPSRLLYWPDREEWTWGDPTALPDWNRAADTSHGDWLSLASNARLFYPSVTSDPPLSLPPSCSGLSPQEGKYKEPLQIPPCRGLICIISMLLQVTVAAVQTCVIPIKHQPNRCDRVSNKSALSSAMISWIRLGRDNTRAVVERPGSKATKWDGPHCFCCSTKSWPRGEGNFNERKQTRKSLSVLFLRLIRCMMFFIFFNLKGNLKKKQTADAEGRHKMHSAISRPTCCDSSRSNRENKSVVRFLLTYSS